MAMSFDSFPSPSQNFLHLLTAQTHKHVQLVIGYYYLIYFFKHSLLRSLQYNLLFAVVQLRPYLDIQLWV